MSPKYAYSIFDGEFETRKPCNGFVIVHRGRAEPDVYRMGFVLDYDQKPSLNVAKDAIYIINIKMKEQPNVHRT